MFNAYRTLGLGALLGFVCGCGGGNPNVPANVSGKVTYKGAAVTGGSMQFHSKTGGAYPASLSTDGTYEARDFPVGEVTVTIETESINPARKTAKSYPGAGGAKDKMEKMLRPPPEGVTVQAATYVKIPSKYSVESTSGLTFTLTRGNQTKNFELTDD